MNISEKFSYLVNRITGRTHAARENDHLFLWSGSYPRGQDRRFILKAHWLGKVIKLIKGKGRKKLKILSTNTVQPPRYPPRIDRGWKAIILTDKGMEARATADYDPPWAITTNTYKPPPEDTPAKKRHKKRSKKNG